MRNLPEVGGGGGGGGTRHWVAVRAHNCISLVLLVVETSHFTASRWAQKITAVYSTVPRIKVKNSAERLSFCINNEAKYRIRR